MPRKRVLGRRPRKGTNGVGLKAKVRQSNEAKKVPKKEVRRW
jgi:hypothetical protein